MPSPTLVAWIGRADLLAAFCDSKKGVGPIAQAVSTQKYESVELLSDFPAKESGQFKTWLAKHSPATITVHRVKLSSPINFGEIYEGVRSVLDALVRKKNVRLTYHLSPGTPAMASVWILLAKTTHPAQLIQSSIETGVQVANIPFDIAVEFIPQLLQKSDERLTSLAQGATDEAAEFKNIIHRSAIMKKVIAQAKRVAVHGIPVLIEGETGTGKELMARAIHRASPRAEKAFISVNCGAIPPELVESEFFGHKKGAFTGAVADRMGHFERADRGTIFLDEIGELPKAVQVKLLRALQEGEVTPVGASESRKVDVRVLAATNRELIKEVSNGNFREDLFYRLAVAIIKLPPLRERAGDISMLIDALLDHVNQAAKELGIKHKVISVSARNFMLQQRWPGNVRELLNTIQRAAIWSDNESISLEAVKDAVLVNPPTNGASSDVLGRPIEYGLALENLMADVAKHYIERAIEHTNGNKTQAAKLLGFGNYQTFTNWMNRYVVER